MKERWKTRHPHHSTQDGIHQMERKGQTSLFRLRNDQNRLKAHLYKTYNIGHTDLCSCGEAAETLEHKETARIKECLNSRFGAS
ncbi:hypothetical protein ElyMa_007067900 [Elysia marginata]|uniref:Uncharacterized protein n=1 Tax=Elysia marginata TaxID=1093978 RepID=A0AAV4JWY0_9GAST|nr:hypothetical protein ElyMa_007067900 [Elysia marginata]